MAMTSGERVRAAVKGEVVDRVPFCFWHHFKPEGSGERMADLTLEFFRTKFSLDIVKIMPDLRYPAPESGITRPEDWEHLVRLNLDTPSFREQLICIRKLRAAIGPDFPLILTLFSPLTMTFQFAGKEQALAHLRAQPERVMQGLKTLADNESDLVGAAIEAGADGIFFSCMGATTIDLTPEEYARYGRPFDLQVLGQAQGGWLNIVHVHADPSQQGDTLYFDRFVDYPVAVMSWSDQLTGPSLREALALTNTCLMAGLAERGPLTHGGERAIEEEMRAAVAQTGGRRLILANGCSIPDDNPEEWLYVARRLVEKLN
jgi:uroporphyrinogen decarboxylase